jgi:hypothetical protein
VAFLTGGGGAGLLQLVYRYTIAGVDKVSIDTGADASDAGSNIWTGGDVLEIWIVAATDDAAAGPNGAITVNNDTGANYDRQFVAGANVTGSAGVNVAAANWAVSLHGAGGTASYPAALHVTIPAYNSTTFNKVALLVDAVPDGTGANETIAVVAMGYRSTVAISRFKVSASGAAKLKVGSQLIVYKRLSS